MAMDDDRDAPSIQKAIDRVTRGSILHELGAPDQNTLVSINPSEQCLIWLHLGCAWLKISIISDLAEFYCSQAGKSLSWLGYGDALTGVGMAVGARDEAKRHYLAALNANPNLAEAKFSLGRVAQLSGDQEKHIHGFQIVFRQHRTIVRAEAHLHANAYWEIANILEDAGRDPEALSFYTKAVNRLGGFGVHHLRYARILRRVGQIDMAAQHYLSCTKYSHRNFPEFMLPPFSIQTEQSKSSQLDVIFTRPDGAHVYFHQGSYVLVPEGETPHTYEELSSLISKFSLTGAKPSQKVMMALRKLL